ncbi:unnamed protein product [Linum trigynum]|uniref:RNase H type-1 domain-containing protein n=1 Tax=Linum trigynum TaxID=586398 RepID=A0AAV2FHC7_9ROSI
MRQFTQQYEEWVRLPMDKVSQPAQTHQPGQVVQAGVICTWDGATRSGSHSAGGLVLLTPSRDVLMAKGVQFSIIDDPMMVELLVLREGIIWCLERGFTDVQFEGDAKVVIDKILQADTRDNRVGAILEEVVLGLSSNPGFSVRFVGRSSNRITHLVARKALSLYPTTSRLFDFQSWLISRM